MQRKEERRRCPRFDLSWPIEVAATGRDVARGRTANISRGGAFFRSPSASSLKPGMTVDVRIGMPPASGSSGGDRTILARARVVRLEELPGGCGIALHFAEEIDALPAASAP